MDDTQINSEAALDAALVWQRAERIRRLRRQVGLSGFTAIALPVLVSAFYFAAYLIDGTVSSLYGIALMLISGASGYASVIARRELAALQLENELKAQQNQRSAAK